MKEYRRGGAKGVIENMIQKSKGVAYLMDMG